MRTHPTLRPLAVLSHLGCVTMYDNIHVVETLHGHDGSTIVEWVD